jgi:hypothetical protein
VSDVPKKQRVDTVIAIAFLKTGESPLKNKITLPQAVRCLSERSSLDGARLLLAIRAEEPPRPTLFVKRAASSPAIALVGFSRSPTSLAPAPTLRRQKKNSELRPHLNE